MKGNTAAQRTTARQKKGTPAKVPLSWRIWAWLGSLVIAACIFALFFFKISRIGAPNPYHPFDPLETAGFGLVFGGLGAVLIKLFVIDKVLLRIVEKKTAVEIVEEVAKDVAVAGAAMVVEGIIDTATGSSDSSPDSPPSGGGGQFGGGGASGSY